jgi:hypothetical protein
MRTPVAPRFAPVLLASVLLGAALALSACSPFSEDPAAKVNGASISASSITDEIEVINANEEYRSGVEQQYGPLLGTGTGTFSSAFAADVLTLRLYYTALERQLDRRHIDVTEADEDAVAAEVERSFGAVFAELPARYQRRLVHDQAVASVADRELSGGVNAAVFRLICGDGADVWVNPRFGRFDRTPCRAKQQGLARVVSPPVPKES